MKIKSFCIVFKRCLVVGVLLISLRSYAQAVPPPIPPPPPPGLSIDGGIGFLAMFGVLYGIRKYKNSRSF